MTIKGTVPKNGFQRPQQGPPGTQPQGGGQTAGRAPFDIDSLSVTGRRREQARARRAVERVSDAGAAREAVLNESYARRKQPERGRHDLRSAARRSRSSGWRARRSGGQASDVYVKLAQLQKLSDRAGRVNTVQVRADSTDDVAAVEKSIKATMTGASVTTASDLADRVGGSLVDAKNLSGKLGTALTIVALVAAFLIATLLTLSSVTKRIRELGTLKALGWPGRTVVRQVTGESVLQGALGGVARRADRDRRRGARDRAGADARGHGRGAAARRGRAGRRARAAAPSSASARPATRSPPAPRRSRSTRPSTSA